MNVAIAGYGVEGQASFQYWNELGADITIFDEKMPSLQIPAGAKSVIGEEVFEKIDDFDLVIRTASLDPKKIKTDAKVWSATNEFFKQCNAPIIGVTGTKGKGTTTSLITEILKAAGKKVHLVGNIGVPALQELPNISQDDIVVFELSSFQLWDLKASPHIAVVLMIEPDHMDIHASLEDYVNAKANICINQQADDVLIYHPTNKYSAQIAKKSLSKKIRFMSREGAQIVDQKDIDTSTTDINSKHVHDVENETWVTINDLSICKTSEVGLLGAHNLENICAAVTAAWQYTQNIEAIKVALTAFTGLPHRLERVNEVDGVLYIDDSFSSAPGATIAAIKSFKQPSVLILGGFDRGLDFSDLAIAIAEQQKIKKVLLIGQTKERLAESLHNAQFSNFQVVESKNYEDIVRTAQQNASAGDVVLLSPGCPSFDMFKNFAQRGEEFKQIVGNL